MKKTLLLLLLLLLCGCTAKDKYEGFKHYDLKHKDYETYSFARENVGLWKETVIEDYAVGVIIKGGNGNEEGLLYKVGDDDYILLDSFDGDGVYDVGGHVYQYEDKLYIVRNELMINEYTLNKEKTTVKELGTKFDYSAIIGKYEDGVHLFYPFGHLIKKVDDDYIYFSGIFIKNIDGVSISIKCSLNDYKCVEDKE